jgi:hypothetical protein
VIGNEVSCFIISVYPVESIVELALEKGFVDSITIEKRYCDEGVAFSDF